MIEETAVISQKDSFLKFCYEIDHFRVRLKFFYIFGTKLTDLLNFRLKITTKEQF